LLVGVQWVLGAAVLLTFSIGSHAAAVAGRGWAILGDYVHLIAAAAWLGGLVLLTVQRFSIFATVAVFILLCTGLFSSLVQLHTLAALWRTTYGWVLLAKIFLVLVALGVALLNNRMVRSENEPLSINANYRTFLRQVGGEQ